MKQIPLRGKYGRGKFALVDDEDYEELSKFKWCMRVFKGRYLCYAVRRTSKIEGNKIMPMHRQIMGNPKGLVVDHINLNTLDNRKENLRLCTHRENLYNCAKQKNKIASSKYKGVTLPKKRILWAAQILKNGKVFRVGGFKTEHYAALARDLWALDIHGKTAYTNFEVIGYGGDNETTPR